MTAKAKLRGWLRDRRGGAAVEFIYTAAMLILLAAALISALIYVTQYYHASYIARRLTRSIEIAGEYNEQDIRSLAETLGGSALEDLQITVDAHYYSGKKIQLRQEFTLKLTAAYRVRILLVGSTPLSLNLPIQVNLKGRSEVFWK